MPAARAHQSVGSASGDAVRLTARAQKTTAPAPPAIKTAAILVICNGLPIFSEKVMGRSDGALIPIATKTK